MDQSQPAIEILKTFGFPIVICFWFMYRQDKRVDRLTEVIQQLAESIAVMNRAIADQNSAVTRLPEPTGKKGLR